METVNVDLSLFLINAITDLEFRFIRFFVYNLELWNLCLDSGIYQQVNCSLFFFFCSFYLYYLYMNLDIQMNVQYFKFIPIFVLFLFFEISESCILSEYLSLV